MEKNELTEALSLPESKEQLKEMLLARPVSGAMCKFEDTITGLTEHDALDFDGTFTLNRSLDEEEVKEITEGAEMLAVQADAIVGWGNWILGNIMFELSKHNYTPENFLKFIPLERRILAQNAWALFREKRYAMPYTHHRDIARGNLSFKLSHSVAKVAEEKQYNQAELRAVVAYAKRAEKAEIEPDLSDDNLKEITTLRPKQDRKKLYYLVYPDGTVREFKGRIEGNYPEEAVAVFEGNIENLIKGELEPDLGGI